MTLISMTCIISVSVAIHIACFMIIIVKDVDFSYEHASLLNYHELAQDKINNEMLFNCATVNTKGQMFI
jgi:hypothetical protein